MMMILMTIYMCVCVLTDMTTPPCCREKVMVYYYHHSLPGSFRVNLPRLTITRVTGNVSKTSQIIDRLE